MVQISINQNTANVKSLDLKGLLPAIDRRKVADPFVVEGKNFYFDADGPKAGFGGKFLTYNRIHNPEYTQFFEVDDESFAFTKTAVLRLCRQTLIWFPTFIYPVVVNSDPHAWTMAHVGTQFFFCHPDVGVLYYDTDTDLFSYHPGPAIPETPIAVCDSYGRLVILGQFSVGWSALDNGLDLSPNLTTGAGFQSISIIGGDPITVASYAGGFAVFTSRGIMRSQFTGSAAVFNHRRLTGVQTAHLAINSFCVISLEQSNEARDRDEGILFLSTTGLKLFDGERVRIWEPIFNEFLVKELERYPIKANKAAIRLTWVPERQTVFLSFSPFASSNFYTHAYCVHLPTQKWGAFNRKHFTLASFGVVPSGSIIDGRHWGYINSDGYFLEVAGIAQSEVFPVGELYYYYKPLRQFPVHYDLANEAYIMPSVMRMGTMAERVFGTLPSGFYQSSFIISRAQAPDIPLLPSFFGELGEDFVYSLDPDEDYMVLDDTVDYNASDNNIMRSAIVMKAGLDEYKLTTPKKEYESLNSSIKIGPIRLEIKLHPDEISRFENIVLGMGKSGDPDAEIIDWNALADQSEDEDYMLLDLFDDYGEDVVAVINYDLRIIGTLDGYEEYDGCVPTMAEDLTYARHFSGDASGIYHFFEIAASEVGQSYHLRLAEFTANVAGRL